MFWIFLSLSHSEIFIIQPVNAVVRFRTDNNWICVYRYTWIIHPVLLQCHEQYQIVVKFSIKKNNNNKQQSPFLKYIWFVLKRFADTSQMFSFHIELQKFKRVGRIIYYYSADTRTTFYSSVNYNYFNSLSKNTPFFYVQANYFWKLYIQMDPLSTSNISNN